MSDNTPNYLQFALENIVKEISEVKILLNSNNKDIIDFKDSIVNRVNTLESTIIVVQMQCKENTDLKALITDLQAESTALKIRLNSIEVEKNTIKGVFSSAWFKNVFYLALVGLAYLAGAKGDVLKGLLELFK